MNTKEWLSEQVFDSLDAMMSTYSQQAVRMAWDWRRQRLDESESSLYVLDSLLNGLGGGNGREDEEIEFQTRLWGAYFGELLRRHFGGEWELAPYPGLVAAVPTLVIAGRRLYPLMKVYRRLTMGESESLIPFYRMVCDRLTKETGLPS